MTNTPKAHDTAMVTQEDRICAKGIRESLSAATGDMLAARHRTASQAELLEALEELLADGHTDRAVRLARAAIARIKGEQS